MKCEELQKDIIDYLEYSLPENKRMEFEKHLPECTACQKTFYELKATLGILYHPQEKPPELGPYFLAGVYQKLDAKAKSRVQIKARLAGALALGIIVITLAINLYRIDYKSQSYTEDYYPAYAERSIYTNGYSLSSANGNNFLEFSSFGLKELNLLEEQLEEDMVYTGKLEVLIEQLSIREIENLKQNLEKFNPTG